MFKKIVSWLKAQKLKCTLKKIGIRADLATSFVKFVSQLPSGHYFSARDIRKYLDYSALLLIEYMGLTACKQKLLMPAHLADKGNIQLSFESVPANELNLIFIKR